MVYTARELAARWKVSEATIIRMCQRGDLAAFRVGAQWRVRGEDVEAFERARTNEPARPPASPRAAPAPLQPGNSGGVVSDPRVAMMLARPERRKRRTM